MRPKVFHIHIRMNGYCRKSNTFKNDEWSMTIPVISGLLKPVLHQDVLGEFDEYSITQTYACSNDCDSVPEFVEQFRKAVEE